MKNTGRAATQICECILQDLRQGVYSTGAFLPAERALAQTHNVAPLTARRALKALEAQGVLTAVPRKGYRVCTPAASTTQGRPLALVLSPRREDWNLADRLFADAFQQAAAEQGVSMLTVSQVNASPEDVVAQLKGANAWGVMLRLTNDAKLAELLTAARIPTLLLEPDEFSSRLDSVAQDSFAASYLAARHLVDSGHSRIGWIGITPEGNGACVAARYAGAAASLAQCGRRLADADCVFMPRGCSRQDEAEAIEQWLAHPKRPSAVVVPWLHLVEVLVNAATKRGLLPGRDFAMVGWCTEELYDEKYVPLFSQCSVQPAVTWSMASLVQTAMARLKDRRTTPGLPAISLNIPATLRLPTA